MLSVRFSPLVGDLFEVGLLTLDVLVLIGLVLIGACGGDTGDARNAKEEHEQRDDNRHHRCLFYFLGVGPGHFCTGHAGVAGDEVFDRFEGRAAEVDDAA